MPSLKSTMPAAVGAQRAFPRERHGFGGADKLLRVSQAERLLVHVRRAGQPAPWCAELDEEGLDDGAGDIDDDWGLEAEEV